MYAGAPISPHIRYPTPRIHSIGHRSHDLTAVSVSIFLLLPLGAGAILGV
jgi:hypothetical protein